MKRLKSTLALLVLLFSLCYNSSFAQQGCLYYAPDKRIFTTPTGTNVNCGGKSVPGYKGSVGSTAGSWVSYGPNDCVTPNPSSITPAGPNNCAIVDPGINYCGGLVNLVVACDLDGYVWFILLAIGCLGARFLISNNLHKASKESLLNI